MLVRVFENLEAGGDGTGQNKKAGDFTTALSFTLGRLLVRGRFFVLLDLVLFDVVIGRLRLRLFHFGRSVWLGPVHRAG